MRLSIVISRADPEVVYNALRLGQVAAGGGDEVEVFLVGRGAEMVDLRDCRFDLRQRSRAFREAGGTIRACGTLLKLESLFHPAAAGQTPLATMKDLYASIAKADRVMTF